MNDLCPDRIRQGLTTQWLGSNCEVFSTIDNTNAELTRQHQADAPHGTIVVANQQTAGRGRRGRTWRSPPDENLYFSLLLRIRDVREVPPFSLAAAVGVASGVSTLIDKPVVIKWPNDVLVDGRKICGILTELVGITSKRVAAIVGIGINVNQLHFDDDIRPHAASLFGLCNRRFDRNEVLKLVVNALERPLDELLKGDIHRVLDQWRGFAPWLGSAVRVHTPTGIIDATAETIAADGALVVQQDNGESVRILSGDVTLRFAPSSS